MVGLWHLPTRHKSPHLSWRKRRLQHKWVGIVIGHIFIHHHLLWRRDPICHLVMSETNTNGGISSGRIAGPLLEDLLRRIILVNAHLRVVRSHGHDLAVAIALLHAAWGLGLVDEARAVGRLVLRCHGLCWRRHHHLLIVHLGWKIFFSILLEMISTRNHPLLRVELTTGNRRGCVRQLLMMLVQEGLVSIQELLLLLLTIHAVSCCQGSTCKVHLRLEMVVLGHHQRWMLVLWNSSAHRMVDLVGCHWVPCGHHPSCLIQIEISWRREMVMMSCTRGLRKCS